MHGLGRCHLGDCGCVTPYIGYRRWGHTLDCRHVTLVQSHPGDCEHRIPGTLFGNWVTVETVDTCRVLEGGHPGDWTCDPRYSFWESVTLDCGHVTPSVGFGRGVTLLAGHMSPGAGYGQEGHPRYCQSVTPGTGSGHSLIAQKLPL